MINDNTADPDGLDFVGLGGGGGATTGRIARYQKEGKLGKNIPAGGGARNKFYAKANELARGEAKAKRAAKKATAAKAAKKAKKANPRAPKKRKKA
jgi:hypothetical protein